MIRKKKIICIKSLTGTGKTKLFKKFLKKYDKNNDKKVLILLSRISLCNDAYKNFKKMKF